MRILHVYRMVKYSTAFGGVSGHPIGPVFWYLQYSKWSITGYMVGRTQNKACVHTYQVSCMH